ncbi:hypothetical protein [Mycobacterium simulans]|uniref:hypothetical protein n=1 Tax=Mycobacterium simulans TaxID=627089 RepID=UPI00174ADD9C|nr:hypothetical protein [Mycobacterium simulans]
MSKPTARQGTRAVSPEAANERNGRALPLDSQGRMPDDPDYYPFDTCKMATELDRVRQDRQHSAAEQRTADRYRARDINAAAQAAQQHDAAVNDAMADLRNVMAGNADVLASSAILTHVAQFADARGAERYATTFGVLMRAVLAVPPQVVLPPIIGGEVSMNLLLALVGASGAGKGTADKTAEATVRLSRGGRSILAPLPMIPIGTGEGINRTYAHAERDKHGSGQVRLRWHTDRALFGCRDIATLDALIARQGSTLVPELLKAYMGEELGFANAEKDRRVILPMHTYRLCLSAGVQPDNGAVLLNDRAHRDGVPQRFIWAPVRPGIARPRRRADAGRIDPLTVAVPDFGIDPFVVADAALDSDPDDYGPAVRPLVPIGVASVIAQQIIDADAAKDADPFGRSADPLAGHRLLAQLKVAAALAILHNCTEVGPEDWQRAERLIEVSSAVARVVTAESASAAERFLVSGEACLIIASVD